MHERCWWHCGSLLVLTILLAAGIWTFKLGFLLSRVELDDQSRCVPNATGEKICFPGLRPTYERAIIIVVDALKHEFLLPNPHLDAHNTKTYQNKVPQVAQLVKLHPESAALFKFIADPPTTTMQRLQGLTTGSLPTFIDITRNFAATTIREDNIVDQVLRMGKNVTFMGDDTWTKLFPDAFTVSFPYPSFDVRDLDTVDQGVMENLIPEIKKNNWTLLIAHLLGVDHCGHRYGRDHPEMARKLGEVNSLIRTVVRAIADDTVLFVMGDHGMTKTGDHGGDSQDEVEAALFVYSHLPWIDTKLLTPSIAQVDFVPTLSLLLGQPIPFSNLGQIIPAFFNSASTKGSLISGKQRPLLGTALQLNADQILRFLERYSAVRSDLTSEVMDNLRFLYERAVQNGSLSSYGAFFEATLTSCREIWAKFDEKLMFFGLTLVAVSVGGLLIILLLPGGLHGCSVLSVAVSLFHFLSMFSNSFQVDEDLVVSFLLQTLIFGHFLRNFQRGRACRLAVLRFLALTLLIRGLGWVRRCREEQSQCSVGPLAVNFDNLVEGSAIYFARWAMGVATPLALVVWCQLRWSRIARPTASSRLLTWPLLAASVVVFLLKISQKIGKFPQFDVMACRGVYVAVIYLYGHLFLFPVFMRRSRARIPFPPGDSSVLGRGISSCSVDLEDSSSTEFCDALQIFGKIYALPLILVSTLLLADTWSFFSLACLVLTWYHFADVTVTALKITVWGLLSWQLFFLTGHQTSIPTIHWLTSAYVGIGTDTDKSQWLQYFLVTFETFSGQILAAAILPSFLLLGGKDGFWLQNPRLFWIRLWRNSLGCILWHASKIFFVMLNAAINRRHLMVWKIFAPRFIFEGLSFGVTTVLILFGYFFSARAFSATLNSVSDLQGPSEQDKKRTKEAPGSRKRR